MASIQDEFVLHHIVEDVSSLQEGVPHLSHPEKHFELNWTLIYCRVNGKLLVQLQPSQGDNETYEYVLAKYKIDKTSKVGEVVTSNFIQVLSGYEEAPMECAINLDDGTRVEVEVHMRIIKVKELPGENLTCVSTTDSMNYVYLIVEGQKFYVLRHFLASRSTYFENLLLGELRSPEVTLPGVKASDFTNFLDVLFDMRVIDDNTVMGILHLGDLYKVRKVIENCEEFLLEDSQKVLKEKFQLAIDFKMEELKEDCLSKVESYGDICSILPDDLSKLDHRLAIAVLQKLVSHQPCGV